MVYWVRDATRRFRERPFYQAHEIDSHCERLVSDFLLKHRGAIRFPITDDDLTVLIERHVDDLDLYADLRSDGDDVEGACRFAVGRKPVIEIAEKLASDERRNNRLRTTLAHELGHAIFHDPVFQQTFSSGDLFVDASAARIVCKRDSITNAPEVDWMEWQACYASGAYLMPKSAVATSLRSAVEKAGRLTPFQAEGPEATVLITIVMDQFLVSREAARVRLTKLGYVSTDTPAPTLFG